jgi:hypothetical protein
MTSVDEDGDDKTLIISPSANIGKKQAAPKARLVCEDESLLGDGVGKEILLDGVEVSVGRGSENSVALKVEGISRNHARIFPGDDAWGIEDLKSTNGVKVNKAKINQTWLKPGDAVIIGKVPYRYEQEGVTPRPAAPVSKPAPKPDLDITGAGEKTMIMRPKDRAAAAPTEVPVAASQPSPKPSATPKQKPQPAAGGANVGLWLVVVGGIILVGVVAMAFL